MRQVDELTVHVVVDNTTDMLSSRPAHVASELRVLREAGMHELTGEALCSAHHGLCLAVTAHLDDEARSVLFDAGPDPYAVERNVQHMNLDLGQIEALVLSHGHFDHSEGLLKALELIHAANGEQTVPLHVHPGAFVKRGMRLPNGEILALQDVPSRRALEENGAGVVASAEPEEILGEMYYLSGEIPRKSFERGLKNHLKQSADGQWEDDPLILDERFMAAHVRGKGIAIFTGCSHAGLLNICSHAQEVFPDVPLYAVVGGLHLVSPNEDIIQETITELRRFGLRVIIPGHCTGWRAVYALVNAFGEEVVDPLAVGSRQTL
jgi:7,8-dihydropterin-6-yl-methyl-4-(beta-D-ribofuranosyl)aminobenzene 5'-phosphate synthase